MVMNSLFPVFPLAVPFSRCNLKINVTSPQVLRATAIAVPPCQCDEASYIEDIEGWYTGADTHGT